MDMKFIKGKNAIITCTGLAIVAAAHISPMLIDKENRKPEDALDSMILNASDFLVDYGYNAGIGLIALGIIFTIISTLFKEFWAGYIEPFLTDHINQLERELRKTRDATRTMLASHQLESAITQSTPQTAKSSFSSIYKKAFGNHCGSDGGLYKAIDKEIHPFLNPKTPHRSNHNSFVDITEKGGAFVWNEVATYRLHTIAFDRDIMHDDVITSPISYPLEYGTELKIRDEDLDEYSLKITVAGTVILDSITHFTRNDAGLFVSSDPDVLIKYERDNLKINLSKNIEINEAWTDVEIEEKTRSPYEDDMLVGMRQHPTCGSTIHMRLPVGWQFEEINMSNNADWKVTHPGGKNALSANNPNWIMPGILYVCRWRKI